MLVKRLSAFKKTYIIIAAALGWAFVADPLISRFAEWLDPAHRDRIRSLNDFLVIFLVSSLLYLRIRRQAREVCTTRDDYRRLFEEVPVPMFIFSSSDLHFLAVNTAAIIQYGYSHAEFLQLKITDIRPTDEVPAFLAAVRQVPEGYADVGRWLHRKKNGDAFFVRVFSHHTVFEGVPAKQTLVIDVDQKVRTEKALAEKTAELENVLESMTDAFYTVDHNWNFTYINKEYERVQRRSRSELLGKNVWELFPYGKDQRYFSEYERALSAKTSVHFEEYNSFSKMWVSASAYPIKSGLAVYFRDITDEKLMREKIAKDSQNLRAIINNTRDLIWSVDRDFNIITGNDTFWERVELLTGKQREVIANADFEEDILRPMLDSYKRAFQGESFLLIRERELDSQKRLEELSFNPIIDHQQQVTGVNCFLRDITIQREHVKQIEKQNEKLREIAWIQSHKIRVPVANIMGLAELSKQNCSAVEDLVPLFRQEAERLDDLIKEITRLAGNIDSMA